MFNEFVSASVDFRENQVEFFRLLPQRFSFFSQLGDRTDDHSDEELGLSVLFLAYRNPVPEILF